MKVHCPDCKSENVGREVIGGQKTGDWVCYDCNFVFDKEDVEKSDAGKKQE